MTAVDPEETEGSREDFAIYEQSLHSMNERMARR